MGVEISHTGKGSMLRRVREWFTRPNVQMGLFTLACAMSVVTIGLFIIWLSNMDSTSDKLWQALLNGQAHIIVFCIEFWQQAIAALDQGVDIAMFLHTPALYWVVGGVVLLMALERSFKPSLRVFLAIGLFMVALPYAWGLALIKLTHPEPTNVGPILAIMLLCPLYFLPLLWVWATTRYVQRSRLAVTKKRL